MDRSLTGTRHPLQVARQGERVVIVGTGETAAIAWDYLTCDSPHDVVAFSTEARLLTSDQFYDRPVVALEELASYYPPESHRVLVAVSSTHLNRLRARLYEVVKKAGFDCISYVSTAAFVWPTVQIGENTFIFENNVVQRSAQIGHNVILWSGNHVGHQTVIEDDCFIASSSSSPVLAPSAVAPTSA